MQGVIDIGSNTMRLVIYKIENGNIKQMLNKKRAAGLVGYINKQGCLNANGIAKAIDVLSEFKEIADNIGLDEIYPFATASLRNINNTQQVLEEIKNACGFDVRVLSGEEEATFDYYGSLQCMEMHRGLIVDVGGGSTELVFYNEKQMLSTQSIPIGSLNTYSQYVKNIIPTKKEIERIENVVREKLEMVVLPTDDFYTTPICGVGGTARATRDMMKNMKKLVQEENQYNSESLFSLMDDARKSPGKVAARILKIAPERIHTLLPGIIILSTIAKSYNTQYIVTSNYGVREGYLYHLLQQRGELND